MSSELFTNSEKAALQFCDYMTKKIDVPAEVFNRVKEMYAFTNSDLVELIALVSGYNMVSRFLMAVRMPLDKDGPILALPIDEENIIDLG